MALEPELNGGHEIVHGPRFTLAIVLYPMGFFNMCCNVSHLLVAFSRAIARLLS